MPRLDRRAALLGGALVVLLALPAVAGFVGPAWELSQWAGLAAAIACILLCGAPLRPRDSQPPTLLSLRLHTAIGYAALILAALHIGGLVLSDHTVIEYLKPTAPLYQFAGIAAALLLALLVLLAHGTVRRRLWKSHRGFQASHVVLACVLAALIAVHVVVTARYLGGIGRRALYIAATIGALLMLLRARRPLQSSRQAPPRPILVFGRRGQLPHLPPQLCRRNGSRPVCRVSPQPAGGSARRSRSPVSRILPRLPSASGRLSGRTASRRARARTRFGLPHLPSDVRKPLG